MLIIFVPANTARARVSVGAAMMMSSVRGETEPADSNFCGSGHLFAGGYSRRKAPRGHGDCGHDGESGHSEGREIR